MTFSPTASPLIFSTKSLTTGRATSASSKATRISRIAAFTSFSDSAPRPVRLSNTPPNLSPSASNIVFLHLRETPLVSRDPHSTNNSGGCTHRPEDPACIVSYRVSHRSERRLKLRGFGRRIGGKCRAVKQICTHKKRPRKCGAFSNLEKLRFKL